MHYDDEKRLGADLTTRIAKAAQQFYPSGIVVPDGQVAHMRNLQDFMGKLGESKQDPLIGWYQGLPVYRSLGRDELLIF